MGNTDGEIEVIVLKREEIAALLPLKESFDLLEKPVVIGDRQCSVFFLDGFMKDDLFQRILQFFFSITPEQMDALEDLEDFCRRFLPYTEYAVTERPEEAAQAVLSGPSVLVIEGFAGAVVMDTRTYPNRGIDEPEKDKVLRGSRDGFSETVVFNTALIRRRIRDPRLTFEMLSVGESSKTDVALGYIDGVADPKLVGELREKIKALTPKNMVINQQNLVELLLKKPSINPFPKVRNTERPDVAAAQLVEGRVVLIVDNCPTAIILPTWLADFSQEADDFYFPPLVGWYMKLIRIATSLLTMLVTPLWLVLLHYQDALPPLLSFLKVQNDTGIPLILQLLLIEFAIDGLRLASVNTPTALASSLSIVGGLILGDFAVQSGVVVPQVIFYMAFVAIATFSQPSIELGYSIKFCRMLLLIGAWAGGLWGFLPVLVFCLWLAYANPTITGNRYFYPVLPFSLRGFIALFKRKFSRNSEDVPHMGK